VPGPLPASGLVLRTQTADGTEVAVTGLPGGALAVALPGGAVRRRRDQLLGELAPRLAHDVHTPLTAVTGHLDLLAHEELPETARRSVDICRREVDRIAALSRDLLALTAVRAGSAPHTVHPAASLAEEATAAVLPEADAHGVPVRVETPAGRATVRAADGELIRALRNLLRNAIQHGGGPTPEVLLRVAADEDSVCFAVSDHGPGIPPGELDRMCEPLVRGPGATGTGGGLGLAIVAEVLRAHGSKLESSRDATGSTLSFRLPRAS
jgi:signal transduction histidine kinase